MQTLSEESVFSPSNNQLIFSICPAGLEPSQLQEMCSRPLILLAAAILVCFGSLSHCPLSNSSSISFIKTRLKILPGISLQLSGFFFCACVWREGRESFFPLLLSALTQRLRNTIHFHCLSLLSALSQAKMRSDTYFHWHNSALFSFPPNRFVHVQEAFHPGFRYSSSLSITTSNGRHLCKLHLNPCTLCTTSRNLKPS